MADNYKILVDDVENEALLWHSWLEIAFVLNGYGTLFIDRERYEIQEEDIFVINSYQIHQIELVEGSHLLSLLIAPEFVEHLVPQAADYEYDCKSSVLSENKHILTIQLAKIIDAWSKSREEFTDLRINIQLCHLIECLIENFGQKRAADDKKGGRWLELVRYINETYQENITLQTLAKREYMSQSYFSRAFQKEMGVTFTEYLTEVRLSHGLNLLAKKELTVTDISFEAGFRNVNSFIESFKQKYGQTPGQYRKSIKEQSVPQKILMLEEGVAFSALFEPLLKILGEECEKVSEESEVEGKNIQICIKNRKETIFPVWKQLLNVGYAKDLLNAEIQKQIIQAVQDIGYRYIRFHGILDDDMMLYREQKDGTPILNFHYVDQVLDFVLQQKMHPYIEFSYMPKALAERKESSLFLRSSVISFPKDKKKWCGMIRSLIGHWQKRYGREEVRQWMFTPFFNIEMLYYCQEVDALQYWEIYKMTWECIKSCDDTYCIVNPPGTAQDIRSIEHNFKWCRENKCVPDVLALTCFHTADPGEERNQDLKLVEMETAFPLAVSKDENYLRTLYDRLQPSLQKYGMEQKKLMLAEWNSNIWQRDLTNDTCFKAAFLFKHILENLSRYDAFGYWTLSDFMEEVPAAEELFHGGFGLFTTNGIPKSSYQALCLLNHLGAWMIDQGEGYAVTGSEHEIQIFLYNYCHYETLYRYRHAANLSRTERYQVFCQGNKKQFRVQMEGMEEGGYFISTYKIGRTEGSAYDAWVRMGAPANVEEYGKEHLKRQAYPSYHMREVMCEGKMELIESIEPQEVMLITIKKMD